MPKLIINKLHKTYGDRTIFSSVDVSIENNGIYVLTGKNGCGKSTLFKILKGIEKADGGEIKFYNSLNQEEDIKENISYCPALPILFDSISAIDNINIVSNDTEKINYYLKLFEIDNLKNKKAKNLSAGERIRVCIIRTILENKPIVLFDEITKHLDRRLRNIVKEELVNLAQDRIIIYTTHYKSDMPDDNNIIIAFANGIANFYDEKSNVSTNNLTKKNVVNYKLVNRVFNWRLNHLFLIVLSIIMFIFAILLTIYFENDYALMYRNSKNTNSYIIGFDNNKLAPSTTDTSKIMLLQDENARSKYKFYPTYYVENFFNIKILSGQENIFDCKVDKFNIVNAYNNVELKDNEVILSDFTYLSLIHNNLHFKVNGEEYFYYLKQKIVIAGVFSTSFEKDKERFNLDLSNIVSKDKNELEALAKRIREFKLENLLLDEKFYFNYSNVFTQMYCNENTFNLFLKNYIERNLLINRTYYSSKDSNADISYDLICGRLPESKDEIVVDKLTMYSLIQNKYPDIKIQLDNQFESYLGEEFDLTINSNITGKTKNIKAKVVGVCTNAIGSISKYKDWKINCNTVLIDYDMSIVNEIFTWKEFCVQIETIGFDKNSKITSELVKEIFESGHLLINTNALSLIQGYKYRGKIVAIAKILCLLFVVIAILIILLSYVLETKFLDFNINILQYISVNRKIIFKNYITKALISLILYSILFIPIYFIFSDITSSIISNLIGLKDKFFAPNILIMITTILIFIGSCTISKYFILTTRLKKK